MASLLRQIVAGPRVRHAEAGLDLCYVTDQIIATSGPSQTYPQRAYRNPLEQLVAFLDSKHGEDWAIWEFRAEGTGYPDEAVYNRIRHYPWPDHHPPPFRLVPMMMASMRDWLHGGELDGSIKSKPDGKPAAKDGKGKGRVVVVHCKAGKGRSGTASCSYLISECGWKPEDALARFTERRMRPKFGAGVSIPSQLRWVSYVDRWTKGGKKYVDRAIEVVEIHVWGLRNGVRADVEAFANEGKKIEVVHTFKRDERLVIEGNPPGGGGVSDLVQDMAGYATKPDEAPDEADFAESTNLDEDKDGSKATDGVPERAGSAPPERGRSKRIKAKATGLIKRDGDSTPDKSLEKPKSKTFAPSATPSSSRSRLSLSSKEAAAEAEPGGMAVILKPAEPIRIANSDVNISFERRNKGQLGLTMVTAVGHVWFNAFFEGGGPEQDGTPDASGVFEIGWDEMDGIKGTSRKGTRALDRLAVVWRAVGAVRAEDGGDEVEPDKEGEEVWEPPEGTPVPQMQPADWKGGNVEYVDAERDLGPREHRMGSADVSEASSFRSSMMESAGVKGDDDSMVGTKCAGPMGEEQLADVPEDAKGQDKTASSDKADDGRPPAGLEPSKAVLENPDTATGTTVHGKAKLDG